MAQQQAGWRFTVAIPLWIDGKDEEGQDVVVSGSSAPV